MEWWRTFASLLGDNSAVATLQRTLNEEAEADKKLTGLAESIINVEASGANGNGSVEAHGEENEPSLVRATRPILIATTVRVTAVAISFLVISFLPNRQWD
jgi:Domain of unknown function (DUF892)